ncbi:MAG: peroxiredoxin [Mariprofundaceae bacterium]|nr:peroxiredoxin [Mariprofundaceae bacterium]
MSGYALNIGDTAPDIELPAWPEGPLRLGDFRGRWVVLFFYPKDNTPGCTREACEFRDASDDFAAANTVILGISRDSLVSHQRFGEKFSLPFPLLSDPDETACAAFDVIRMKNMYGRQVRGVERSTFIINPDGVIAHLWRKVKVKEHVADVLATLKHLQENG